MRRQSLFIAEAAIFFFCAAFAAFGQETPASSGTYQDDTVSFEAYLAVEAGTLPVVLSAPHGGGVYADGVPERVLGTIDLDFNTLELALLVQDELAALMDGRKAFLVAARMSRTCVDFNRAASQAYESKPMAAAYQAYHDALKAAVASARSVAGEDALLIDIHGQSQDTARVYRGTQNGRTADLFALYGDTSGGFAVAMKQEGLLLKPESVDSREYLEFNGGFIVLVYGRSGSGGINALQLEFGFDLRKDRESLRRTAKGLALAIKAYLDKSVSKIP